MEQKNVLVQVIFPSSSEDCLCHPAACLHEKDLLWLKSHGYYLDCNDTMLVEYTFDDESYTYRRSAVCKIGNGAYIDIKL